MLLIIQTIAAKSLRVYKYRQQQQWTRPMCRSGLYTSCAGRWQFVGLIGRGWPFGRFVFNETPPKHAADPRDGPAGLETPKGLRLVWVRVRVRSRVGLVWATVQDWKWPVATCASFVQVALAHRAGRSKGRFVTACFSSSRRVYWGW